MSRTIGAKRRLLYYACGQTYCAGCGNWLEFDQTTVDHRMPKSKGGGDSWFNLQLMCGPCNQKKGNRFEPATC